MPLFICSTCGGIDNTALGVPKYIGTEKRASFLDDPALYIAFCAECAVTPNGQPGTWHNKFAKEIATEETVRKLSAWGAGGQLMHLGQYEYLREELTGGKPSPLASRGKQTLKKRPR